MNNPFDHIFRRTEWLKIVSGLLLLLSLCLVRKYYFTKGPFIKGTPDPSLLYIVSTVLIIISLALLYLPLHNQRPQLSQLFEKNKIATFFLPLLVLLSIFFTSMLFLNPTVFNQWSLEDNLVEWVSFSALCLGCFLLLGSWLQNRKNITDLSVHAGLIFFALLFALIALEEVSWFQRVFEFGTPDLFEKNDHHETNLHNFVTHYSENLYYTGTHLYFVVIPMAAIALGLQRASNELKVFLADPALILVALLAASYNYNMWNSIFIQATFFSSLFALYFLRGFTPSSKDKTILLIFGCILLVEQTIFLCSGERYQRLHEITEYKEFFIALTLLAYAIHVRTQIKTLYRDAHNQ